MSRNWGVVSAGADVRAPADHVFAEMVRWENQGRWMLGTYVRAVLGDADDVGGRIDAWTGVGRLGFLDTMVITRWDESERVVLVEHIGKVVRGEGVMRVSCTAPDRCRVQWCERLEVPGGRPGLVGWRAIRPLAAAGLAVSLRRFAREVDREHGARGDHAIGSKEDRE